MAISDKEMQNLLTLARLNIDASSTAEFKEDLSNILQLLDDLQKVKTQDVAPLTNPLDEKQILRADKVAEEDQRELFLRNAPQTEAGLYLVPQVVDN